MDSQCSCVIDFSKKTFSMCSDKLSEIEINFLFSKIIIWSEKLSDNNIFLFLLI